MVPDGLHVSVELASPLPMQACAVELSVIESPFTDPITFTEIVDPDPTHVEVPPTVDPDWLSTNVSGAQVLESPLHAAAVELNGTFPLHVPANSPGALARELLQAASTARTHENDVTQFGMIVSPVRPLHRRAVLGTHELF